MFLQISESVENFLYVLLGVIVTLLIDIATILIKKYLDKKQRKYEYALDILTIILTHQRENSTYKVSEEINIVKKNYNNLFKNLKFLDGVYLQYKMFFERDNTIDSIFSKAYKHKSKMVNQFKEYDKTNDIDIIRKMSKNEIPVFLGFYDKVCIEISNVLSEYLYQFYKEPKFIKNYLKKKSKKRESKKTSN